ncbi:hypothetical protein HDU99_009343, partial [Rhizoclosmatium hyalinum]
VVAGGAVAACLHPWPRPLRELYDREVLYRRVLGSILNRLPPEIVDLIEFYAGFVRRVSDVLDRALFTHLCGSNSPYAGSDVDVFFVCGKGDTTVDKALDHLPKVYHGVLENRTKANVAKYIDKRKYKRHWIFTEPDESDPDYDWFIGVKAEIDARKAEEAGVIGFKSFIDKFHESDLRQPKDRFTTRVPTDERGWNSILQEAVKARLQLLWTVRTTNSITITGVHPVRHTQLMLPVVRAPEQVVYPFDLDCVTVYYDGTTVYATPRSLRAFNTRTNFVDTKSLQDRARCIRMLKYSTRGFNTLAFEICRHFPRCDVDASRAVREVIERGFPAQVEVKKVEKTNNNDDDFEDDEWIPLRFDPDLGNPDLEPAVNLMGENRSEDESKPRRIAICSDCQSFNLKKREEVVDLTGKHALVTGGRIKIGQAAALRLLRNGATVHVTTRFPLLLLHAFKSQPDAEVWWSRLNVYGLDLRDLGSVLTFCNHLVQKLEHLDILIQNAAQTIRRPAAYYAPMVKAESDLRESLPGHILANWVRFDSVGMIEAARRDIPAVLDEAQQTLMKLDTTISRDLSSSVLRSLIVPGDVSDKAATDPNWNLQVAQQSIDPLDMRPSTTWNQSLPDVALSEVAEVLVVNSLAPTLLMQRLQPLLSRPRDYPAFVVNVSSREGSFSATQKQGDAGSGFDDTTGLHPHTNMAKAALNRLTQTIAEDWAKDGVYVTAVDPGWVSLMGPVVMEDGKGVGGKTGVIPPLSVEDGAARVLAPVFDGYSNGVLMSGVLLRNFQVSSW